MDSMVYGLYFLDEIKATECEVPKHLTDLPELKMDWSDEQKLAVIEKSTTNSPTPPISYLGILHIW